MKIDLKEISPGKIKIGKWPKGVASLWPMVFTRNRSYTMWGAPISPVQNWEADLRGAVKRGYVMVEFWFDGDRKRKSEMIPMGGYNPKDEEWERAAIEYQKLSNWLRQRIGVNEQLAETAMAELRPAGAEAHTQAAGRIKDFLGIVNHNIKHKSKLPAGWVEQAKQKVEAIEKEANGKVQIYPDPPEQKWYETPKYKFLKAKSQFGHDRNPHELRVSGDHLLFVKWGREFMPMQGLYWGTEINRVYRGDFIALNKLKGSALGKTLTGNLYISDGGKEVTHFEVPPLKRERKTPPPLPRESFGPWLKDKRTAKRLLQKELASMVGVGRSTISNYERGKSFPRKKTMLKIKEIFKDG